MESIKKLAFGALIGSALILAGCDDSTDRQSVPSKVQVSKDGKSEEGGECAYLSPWGFPKYNPPQKGNFFLCHEGYALEFNGRSRTSMWSVERLKGTDLQGSIPVRDDFRPDPRLADGATVNDYANQPFAKGQLASPYNFVNNKKKMSFSYYLSNVVPQEPTNKAGIWTLLENNTRQWSKEFGEVYIMTGPIYYNGRPLGYIGEGGEVRLMNTEKGGQRGLDSVDRGRVAIPTHLYKIVYAPSINQAIAFVIPNIALNPSELPKYVVTVSTVEYYTGLTFLPQLSNSATIKNQIPLWNMRLQ